MKRLPENQISKKLLNPVTRNISCSDKHLLTTRYNLRSWSCLNNLNEMEKPYQLPKEFVEKWIAALRSGEYYQGRESLRNGDCYCCLGVACEISGVDLRPTYHGFPKDLNLPKGILPGLLLESGHNFIPGADETRQINFVSKVAALNDEGANFNQIADWIEKHVDFIPEPTN